MSREVMTIRPMVIDRGGGACEESQAPFFVSPFRKGAKGYLFISLMQEKRNQRVHYPQGPLQRGMQLTTRGNPLRQSFGIFHKAFALRVKHEFLFDKRCLVKIVKYM